MPWCCKSTLLLCSNHLQPSIRVKGGRNGHGLSNNKKYRLNTHNTLVTSMIMATWLVETKSVRDDHCYYFLPILDTRLATRLHKDCFLLPARSLCSTNACSFCQIEACCRSFLACAIFLKASISFACFVFIL